MTNVKKPGKKRGRKPKNEKKIDKPPPKKRGRKPKGGKIIKNFEDMNKNQIIKKTNVILHLKCSTHDLNNEGMSDNNPTFLNNAFPSVCLVSWKFILFGRLYICLILSCSKIKCENES